MSKRITASFVCILLAGLLLAGGPPSQAQQQMTGIDREHVRGMLRDAYQYVKKYYYDPKIHGLDWDARYHDYDEKMKNAKTMNQGLTIVAGFLDVLKDSHTRFSPPSRPYRIDYGYRVQIIGDRPYITRVRPGTDAESKVKVGDQVVTLNGFDVDRGDVYELQYFLNTLSPQPATKLAVRSPSGQESTVVVAAKTKAEKLRLNLDDDENADLWQLILREESADHVTRHKYYELGDVMIWRMPQFDLDNEEVDNLFSFARKHKTLILDLRGNPGGHIKTLERMVGNVFDHDVKIADRVGKKPELKPQLGKTRGGSTFTGKLIVLVDSNSASSAELFSRVIQLEHRGTVIGDRSAGKVMESLHHRCSQGTDANSIFYGFSITEANLIMTDGKSLEGNGVTPDEIVLPTAEDLAAGRDPVLAYAAKLAGLEMDPVKAGKLFPFEWVSF
jgi:carboxyl-terminal processing protease